MVLNVRHNFAMIKETQERRNSMTQNEEPKLFDKEKVKEISEKVGATATDATEKAGEVLGDAAKIAVYGSLEAAKVIGKTSGSFFKGVKRGFQKNNE